MVFTTFRRIVRTGFVGFWRNGFLSFAAVVVMTLALSAFGSLILASAFSRSLLEEVSSKVDINVYFSLTAPEASILSVKKDIEALPEVSKVEYVSSAEALIQFRERWKNNALIMQGLDEVGGNPFPASLNVRAKDPSQYGNIATFLVSKNPTDETGTPVIEKVNYEENKLIIDRLTKIIPTIETGGLVIALVLILVAVIVVWNTIRLIIYTAREEISVMKLVGASNAYARGPFVVSGLMYGIVAALITLLIMAAFAYWGDLVVLRLAGVDIASNFELVVNVLSGYFITNFGQIFGIIMGAGLILGGLSSYIAARRYLKV